MKLFVLKSRWAHMGGMSGFPLWGVLRDAASSKAEVIDLPVLQDARVGRSQGLKRRIFRKLGLDPIRKMLSNPEPSDYSAGSPWSHARHTSAAVKTLRELQSHTDAVALLPAAEDEFCAEFALAKPDLKRRIFVCFHQPPAWFRLNWRRFEDLNSLGGIFCLSGCQAEYFKSVSSSPVHQIRHGVRHDFFCPPNDLSVRSGAKLLFVGQWLRDFETLAESMLLIWKRRPDVRLDCVVPRSARGADSIRRLATDDRVVWHSELTDECLRDLYQKADLLFLPVLDATANNAVLEAMASGLPVISSKIGGIGEYLPEEAGQLCGHRDASAHADTVIDWLANSSKRLNATSIARKAAVDGFDWANIGRNMLRILLQSRQ
jgi:glycosyltransferase involved in cell wall biosynthesis